MIPLIVALVPFDRSSMEPSHRSTATALISRRQQLPHRGTITYDLHFGRVAMLFSWSSCGTLQGYLTDETNVRWAQNDFPEFLRLSLSQLGLTTVHAVAHSMGNRVLAEILGAAASLREDDSWARFDQIVFAAPDIDTASSLVSSRSSGLFISHLDCARHN
jgi:Alpha/beta hydrolase of unknown function (DUF900)